MFLSCFARLLKMWDLPNWLKQEVLTLILRSLLNKNLICVLLKVRFLHMCISSPTCMVPLLALPTDFFFLLTSFPLGVVSDIRQFPEEWSSNTHCLTLLFFHLRTDKISSQKEINVVWLKNYVRTCTRMYARIETERYHLPLYVLERL